LDALHGILQKKISEKKQDSMKKLLVVLMGLFLVASTATAQKYGHLNFGNVLTLMPETKTADETLKKYQEELVAKGEEMAKKFQESYTKALAEVREGKLSPLQQQRLQSDLEKEQQAIADYEEEISEKIQTKREELLRPIVDKADKLIEEIAKANGYVLIFDTSAFNTILFAQDADDVMPLVKAKLGISDKKD
jgi:outer membrane protein